MSLEKLPEIDESVKKRFVNAVKEHHEGKKWGVLKEELENALLFYVEMGPLSEEPVVEDLTTGDVEKIKLTIPKFLQLFDNIQIRNNPPVYGLERIAASELKEIITEITGKTSDYNWRKWSKILKESGRIKQLKGTMDYLVIRNNFNFIDESLKKEWNKNIKERELDPLNIQNTNLANRIYDKLTSGKITSLNEICRLGKIQEKKGKKVIDKLVHEHKLCMVGMGRWKVTCPKYVKNVGESSVFQIND